jgi:uncharacterized protein VirK/YbjX
VAEKPIWTINLDIDESMKELEEIQKTKRDLYELMRFNLDRIVESLRENLNATNKI